MTIETDDQRAIVEGRDDELAENNNQLAIDVQVTLSSYPDLLVEQLTASPTTTQTGSEVTVRWNVRNQGRAPVQEDFQERIRLIQATTGQVVVDQLIPYSIASLGSLAVDQVQPRQVQVRIPDGSASAGRLHLSVTTDASSAIFEYDAWQDAESNNTVQTTLTSSLAPYPDLRVSQVVAPERLIADPARLTVSWTVENVGQANALPRAWFDTVILSSDLTVDMTTDCFREVDMFARKRSSCRRNSLVVLICSS